MQHIGIDLAKTASQVCILTEEGELIERRLPTTRDHLARLLATTAPARILLEASTESEWVARYLESLGHEVIVADPNFAPMYATRSRRVKTDKRDARALCEACRLGAYRSAHRTSDRQRHVRAKLAVREALVRTRSKYISLIRALVRRDGLRVAAGTPRSFATRLDGLPLSATLRAEVTPLLTLLEGINEQITRADEELARLVKDNAVVKRLTSAPGVGAVTAACFVSTLDDVTRFASAKQVRAYLGLVPSEYSSGERRERGRINKAGPPRARYLLVEAAWALLRSTGTEGAELRAWATAIRNRRGTKVAIVALARKLAGILFAMWRDGADFALRSKFSSTGAAST
jgi:transposase